MCPCSYLHMVRIGAGPGSDLHEGDLEVVPVVMVPLVTYMKVTWSCSDLHEGDLEL